LHRVIFRWLRDPATAIPAVPALESRFLGLWSGPRNDRGGRSVAAWARPAAGRPSPAGGAFLFAVIPSEARNLLPEALGEALHRVIFRWLRDPATAIPAVPALVSRFLGLWSGPRNDREGEVVAPSRPGLGQQPVG